MTLEQEYDKVIIHCRDLLVSRNQRYGDSWKVMRETSFIDHIHMKLHRITDNNCTVEDRKEIYQDSINYLVMAMIKLQQGEQL